MLRMCIRALIIIASLMTPAICSAQTEFSHSNIPLKVGGQTSVPYGWVEFCQRYASECTERLTTSRDVVLTAKSFRAIERINRWVNKNVEPVSDTEHWGMIDQWDYPADGKGDCEDYALLKRKLLVEAGFPIQALLMTVVKDLNGEGHAILTIKTDRGDFILDNVNDNVKSWSQTGYRFLKRQSQIDPNLWVSLSPPTATAYVASTVR